MVENQHRQIQGYRDLRPDEIALINEAKALEVMAEGLHRKIYETLDRYGMSQQAARDLALARTAFEDATMRLVRAIAQPVSPWTRVG